MNILRAITLFNEARAKGYRVWIAVLYAALANGGAALLALLAMFSGLVPADVMAELQKHVVWLAPVAVALLTDYAVGWDWGKFWARISRIAELDRKEGDE
jgi:hypothetical protein